MRIKDFPDHFRFGVATSSYQIEGAVNEDGRGESIWDRFATQPGRILNGDTGAVACDHYHRWQEDLDLIRDLGVHAYRFSVAWPRVLPAGTGRVEQRGLDFYDRLVDGLLEREVEPHVTLYHWDLPQALEDRGGWRNRDTAHAFADYAAVLSERLGDRPVTYSTLNEPWCSSLLAHYIGEHAPGIRDLRAALSAAHNLLLGHGLALEAIRAAAPGVSAGIVLNFSPAYPASDSGEDAEASRRHDGFFNRWFLDPLFRGSYPEDMLELYGAAVPEIGEGDMAVISRPLDFLGVNFYNRAVIRHDAEAPLGYVQQRAAGEYTAMNWEVHPPALTDLLLRLQRDYKPEALFVMENGAAFEDELTADGRVHDEARRSYLERHIRAALTALQGGAGLQGYFAWSLLDNFEWAYGYSKRFGLVHVDFDSQKRTLKDSALWYRDFLKGAG